MTQQNPPAYCDAKTNWIPVDAVNYAFRALGAGNQTPVVLVNHRGANLDNFDPNIVDGSVADRPVFALD